MKRNTLSIVLVCTTLIIALVTPAMAGQVHPRKIKKWPEVDRAWARSFDAWMTDEELGIFLKLKTTDQRKDFLTEAGYWKLWKKIEDEMLPNVIAGDVVNGMTKDEVFMCWDKPKKIRKDFRKNAYVDVLNYEFEIDRKGREFLLRQDSQTAYKNEIVTKYVYLYNGKVFSIVYAGEEENVFDELPVEENATPAPPPPAPAGEESTPTEAAKPAND